MPIEPARQLHSELSKILDGKGRKDIGWKNLSGYSEKQICIEYIKLISKYIEKGNIRIDTLLWDIYDSRHKDLKIDDPKNLGIMYYHLLRNVLSKRWPSDTTWKLFPDQHSGVNWNTLEDCIVARGQQSPSQNGLGFNDANEYRFFKERLRRTFNIKSIEQAKSEDFFIVQIADIFAGAACFMYKNPGLYKEWLKTIDNQVTLPFMEEVSITKSNKSKLEVIHELIMLCKNLRFSTAIDNGIVTRRPEDKINFWLYDPKSKGDKAPIKQKRRTI